MKLLTSIAILAVSVSTANAEDGCCTKTASTGSSCPAGLVEMPDVEALCCPSEDSDRGIITPCTDGEVVGVLSTDTDGTTDTTTTTTSNGGEAASECCLTPGDASSCPSGFTFIGENSISMTFCPRYFCVVVLILILSISPLDDVDTIINGVNHHARCQGGNFEMELMDLDMCSDTASAPTTTETGPTDEGMSDGGASAATKEHVTIAIGMVLVGVALQ